MIQTQLAHKELDWQEESKSYLRIKRRRQPVNKEKVLTKLIMCIFVLGILAVFLYVQGALMGYKMVALEKRISELETDNKRLELSIAEFSSLDRVQHEAETRLGMYRAEPVNMVAMVDEPRVVPVIHTAERPVVEKQAFSLQRVYQAITSLLSNARIAELGS